MSFARDLASVARSQGFRRLFVVRMVTRFADGAFQAGLATLAIFSPESQSTAAGIAVVTVVLLGPFTLVGPFTGSFLDHWDRRGVLVYGQLIRVGVTLAAAALLITGGLSGWLYLVAMVNVAAGRFINPVFSAALPRVVERDLLLLANSVVPTLSGIATGFGIALGFLASLLLPAGAVRDAGVVSCAAVFFALSATLATRFATGSLGPTTLERSQVRSVRTVVTDLAGALRYLNSTPSARRSLLAMGAQRFAYGGTMYAGVLLCRGSYSDPTDLAAGASATAAASVALGAGFALAIVLTSLVRNALPLPALIGGALIVGAGAQGALAGTVTGGFDSLPVLCACAFVVSLAAQTVKIATDTTVQRDVADAYRGRAFIIFDALYNGALIAAGLLLPVLSSNDGRAGGYLWALVAAHLVALAVLWAPDRPKAAPAITP